VGGGPAALAAKRATSTIPIVFMVGPESGAFRARREREQTWRQCHGGELLYQRD